MGRKDTDSANNPLNEGEIAANRELEQPRVNEDSDSDLDEINQLEGYMPLSQNPNDAEPLYDLNESEDDEINIEGSEAAGTSEVNHTPVTELKPSTTSLVEEVWSKQAPRETDIEMSDKKIDLVKQVMVNVQLPSEAIPAWAKNIPEEDWKDHLLQKLNKSDK